jgi:DNA-binding NtrC family response regulator
MKNKRDRILMVEDDRVDRMAFERFARESDFPYDYIMAGSVNAAKKILKSEKVAAAVMDYSLGDGTAFDLFGEAKDIPIVIVTGTGDEEIAVKAMKIGASDYVIKDPESNYLKTLSTTVENAIRNKRNEAELKQYRKRLEGLVKERTAELRREIEERRRAEEKIQKQIEFLSIVMESLTHPFYVIDASDYTVKMANEAAKLGGLS